MGGSQPTGWAAQGGFPEAGCFHGLWSLFICSPPLYGIGGRRLQTFLSDWGRRSEDGGQRTEDGGRRSVVSGQWSEVSGRRTEDRRRTTDRKPQQRSSGLPGLRGSCSLSYRKFTNRILSFQLQDVAFMKQSRLIPLQVTVNPKKPCNLLPGLPYRAMTVKTEVEQP